MGINFIGTKSQITMDYGGPNISLFYFKNICNNLQAIMVLTILSKHINPTKYV